MKILGLFCCLFILISSCRKSTTWDTNWVTPLINDTLDLTNLVNDSTLAISGGYYNVNLKRTLLDINVSDFVSIPDTTIAQVFTLSTPSLTIPPGSQFVNSVEEHNFDLQDLELKKIILKNGVINLEIKNPVQEPIKMVLELPGVSLGGVPLIVTYIAPGGTQSSPGILKKTIDLAGYTINMTGTTGNKYNVLLSKVIVSTLTTGNSVVITNQDHIVVNATFKDISLKYARGYFGSRIIQDTTDFNIDFFQNIAGGTIDLPTTSVKVIVENSIKFDAKGKLNYLKNENYAGTIVAISGGSLGTSFALDQPIGSFGSLQPTFVELLFNSGNSNIENYFENLGIKHSLSYQIQINPWGNTSGGWNEIYENSKLKLSVEATMPLSIQSNNLNIRDTFDFKLDQSKDKTRISSGTFILDANNAFPFSGDVNLRLLDENKQQVHIIQATNPILSSLYGALNASGIQCQKSNSEFVISESMVKDLDRVKFIVIDFVLNTPDPITQLNQMVGIPANSFLGIKLKAKFNLKAVV